MRRPPERPFFVLFMSYWLPVLAYVAIILVLSAQPALEPPLRFPYSDKVFHALEYFGLGLLSTRTLRATLRVPLPLAAALIALSFGTLVGTGDEYFQSFIPGRDSSALDLLADTAGLLLAMAVYLLFTRE